MHLPPLRRTLSAVLSIALIFIAQTAISQDLDDVTFSGKIVDSNDLAVVGATVTITETASEPSEQ